MRVVCIFENAGKFFIRDDSLDVLIANGGPHKSLSSAKVAAVLNGYTHYYTEQNNKRGVIICLNTQSG